MRKFCNGCEKYLNCVEGKYMEEAKTATEILEQDYQNDIMAQHLIQQYRAEDKMTDEQILEFMIEFY